jgi:hypothetical protein
MSLREQFIGFDDELASHGVPPLTAWWREGVGQWLDAYESGRVLELWACAGRGSAKSTALYKLATFFTLFGDFTIPPGERHFAIVLSRLVSEAGKGISIIAAWLRLLGVDHVSKGDVVEIVGSPRGIRVVAASVGAASGWRAYFVGKDERSKWAMGGAEELDAEEVDTSATAMTATHPLAPVVTVGSAWGDFGGFHDAIASGTDADKVVLGPVPTWIAAPHILEADLRRRERDPRKFAREYESKFQSGAFSAFEPEDIERAYGQAVPSNFVLCDRVLFLDPSAGGSDSFAFCVVGWALDPSSSKAKLVVQGVGGVADAKAKGVSAGHLVDMVGARARAFFCTRIISDQFEKYSLANAFSLLGFAFDPFDWTSEKKEAAVGRVREWLREDMLVIVENEHSERMRTELLSFEEKISPKGALTFKARRGGHDDYAMLIMLAALADLSGFLSGSPQFEAVRMASAEKDLRIHAMMAELGYAKPLAPAHVREMSARLDRQRYGVPEAVAKWWDG